MNELVALRRRVAELEAVDTERRRAEEVLQGSEECFRSLFDTIAEGVILIAPDGQIVRANPAAERILGLSRSEIEGRNYVASEWGILRPDGTPMPPEEMAGPRAMKEKGLVQDVVMGVKRPDGSVSWINVSATPLMSEDSVLEGVVGTFVDITERKRAEEEIRRRTAQLEALRQVGLEITAELDLDSLLHSLVSRAIELVGGTAGGLYLYRPDLDVLVWVMAVGPDLVPIETILQRGEGLSGTVWETGEPLIVDDYRQWEGRVTIHEDYPRTAVVGVPVYWGEKFLGVLKVLAEAPHTFSSADAELLSLFATQAAIAIRNACLFEGEHEQRDLSEALAAAAAVISSTLDPDQVLDRILEQVSRVVPNDAANIMLIKGDRARVVRWRGYERFGAEEFISAIVCHISEVSGFQQMVCSREPLAIPDTANSPDWVRIPVTDWLRSYAGAPIVVRGEVIGFLNVDSTTPGFFTQEDAETLRAFADHAAVAIGNARLYEAEQERRYVAETLRQASTVFSSTLELNEVLGLILQQLRRVIPYDSASVQRLQDGNLEVVACQEFEKPEKVMGLIFPLDSKFPNRHVLATRAPLAIEDVVQDYPHFGNESDTYESGHIRSWLGVPLMVKDEVIGMISVDRAEVQPYTAEEAELAVAFANQAAVAIENARLYEGAQQELAERRKVEEALRRRAEELAALQATVLEITAPHNLPTLLQAIVERAAQLLDALGGGLYLCDPDREEARCVVSYNTPGDYTGTVLKYGEGAAGTVAQTGEPLIVDDYRTWNGRADVYEDEQPFTAVLSAPMIWQGQVTGVIHVLHNVESRRFTPTDLELLTLFANHAAIAVENARLYEAVQQELAERKRGEEEVRQRTAQLEALRQVGLELAAELDLDALLYSITRRAIELLGGTSGGLYLHRPEQDVLEWTVSIGLDPARMGSILRPGEGVCGKVWETDQPLIVNDYHQWEGRADGWEGYSFTAVMGVPVRWREEFLGVLEVDADSPHAFSLTDAELLSLFATQAAIAIRNARLFESEREQRALNKALREAAAVVTSTLDPTQVLDRILQQVSRVVPNDATNIMLIEGNEAYVARWRGYERFSAEEFISTIVFRIPEVPNLQQMLENQEPIAIPDTATYPGWVDLPVQKWLRSYAAAPIAVRGEVIGFLNVDSATPNFFTQADAEALRAFADHAAAAIENARLYATQQQRAQESSLLLDVANTINSTLDMTGVLRPVAQRAAQVCGANRCTILLLDDEGKTLIPAMSQFASGTVDEKMWQLFMDRLYPRPLAEVPEVQQVLREGWPLFIPDVLASSLPRYWIESFNIKSLLVVPMISKGQPIGVMGLDHAEEGKGFADEQVNLAMIIGSQAAIAVENARLYEEAKRHSDKLAALYKTGTDITLILELDVLLQLIAERSARLTGADKSLILLVDTKAGRLTKAVGFGFAPDQVEDFTYQEVQDGISGWALRERTPTISEDVLTDPRNTGLALQRTRSERERGKSIAVAPLLVGDKVIGTLTAINNVGKPVFSQDDLGLVAMLASQAAIAIENARLYEQAQQEITERKQAEEALERRAAQLATVSEIGRQIASILDLDELLRQMVDLLQEAFGYRYVYILLLDEEANELVARAGAGPGRVLEGTRIPVEARSINACVARTGEPLLANDVSGEPMYLLLEEIADTKSELCVPIRIKNQVIGTIDVQCREIDAFDESDLVTLQTLADQVAIAIETARLFTETEGRAGELALLLDTSTAISSTLDLDQVLETVARQITTSLVATSCHISLLDGAKESLVIRVASSIRDQKVRETLGKSYPLAVAPCHKEVIETGEPLVLHLDVAESALSDEECRMILAEGEKSVALVPLSVGRRVLGVISLGEARSRERGPFTPEKVKLCQSIARQAAVAIENARLYEETQQRLQELAILVESGAMVGSTFDLKELLSKVSELMTLSIGVEACGISIWDKEEGVVHTLAEYSSAVQVVEDGATYRLDDYPATAQSLYSGQPFQAWVDDPSTDERERVFLEEWAMKSLLALPIAGEKGIVGLLELYDGEQNRTFSPEEIARGQAWARQMAPIVERTPMLRQSSVQSPEGEGERDSGRALRQLAIRAMRDLDVDWCAISRWDRAGEQVVTLAECGDVIWPREAGASYPLSDYPATAHVLRQRQPLVVRLDDPTADEWERALLEEEGWGAMLALPMVVRNEVIGLAELFDRRLRPFTTAEIELAQTLVNQAAIALENTWAQEELQKSFQRLQRTLEGTVSALMSAVEMRDRYTAGHQRRVTQLACAIANEMGLPEERIEGLRMAGLIHDLGKINVPAEILSKPGRLNDIEYGLIKAHPQVGYDVLKTIDFPWPVAQIVLQHHERLNGSGYPQGLLGEGVLLEARILAVADVVEAMASFRPYRPALGIDRALEEISQNRGVFYDPEVVEACLKLFAEKGFEFE